VVAPRSLLFNWMREAERFAPALRVAEYHGAGRDDVLARLGELDLVLTTYGTLRRDAAALSATGFDYVILDEAQAIKNASTASAKATRLLRPRHRLALSGTPIENQLGDLWSLFEFLNPGLLGSLQHGLLARARKGDAAALDTLRRGLRPFILRRTKQQVAPELPARNEDTMLCELEPAERRLYDQLRDHYRQVVLGLVDRQGLQRSRFQILEALLRLRQAACHPGLIDPKKHAGSSAKLDALLERLDEARAEGHKALVFSQFTSFLALVRRELDARDVPYEYLDGQTRDRERRVARFQQDPACPLFLVSLKAGGLGLNLTAADYVFLLDPWWNPAVEAQAIDRAHRIGQERPVFAYRLIAAATVEERIVELQARKRQLADAIISADNSGLAGLTREDLELLLG
jgi:SNF2 family DNA or RNA helicase